MELDGSFPTVTSPNPEYPEGFKHAIDLANNHNADLIIGTDPDCDRVGIMVRNDSADFIPLTGNQVGVLLIDYLIDVKTSAGLMPDKPTILKTIVTTELARHIAEVHNVSCYDTFTGFKFMAEKKNALESTGTGKVFFAFEESYGYLAGDFVRDKDAVTASVLIAEMAAQYAEKGMTLYNAIEKLYEKYGQYAEKTINLQMPGLDGIKKMQKLMSNLRETPPSEIAGSKITVRRDYQTGEETNAKTGAVSPIELSGSNVLRFETEDGTVILVRPSGTEPKVKVYIMSSSKTRAECDVKIEKYVKWANELQEIA
jgi:phosphoglucomutase